MRSDKKVFVSYSHSDRDFAERLANALVAHGQQVWFDKWDIQPGDSIITKIFEEGLADAAAFVVILSKESVASPWVREELNVATVRRIEDLTRVIPILKEDVEIPIALRTLHWVDMRTDVEAGIRSIVNVLSGVSERPELGETPPHIRKLVEPVAGLSRLASTVGQYLLQAAEIDGPFTRAVRNAEMAEELNLQPTETNDGVDELKSQGLAKTNNTLGNHPYEFEFVEGTYLLFHAFENALPYSPSDDVRVVLAAIAALDKASGAELQEHTHLSHGRLNRAVAYIKDHGYADVLLTLGTAPYGFHSVRATRATRQAAVD
jgi:hypothetical protein